MSDIIFFFSIIFPLDFVEVIILGLLIIFRARARLSRLSSDSVPKNRLKMKDERFFRRF